MSISKFLLKSFIIYYHEQATQSGLYDLTSNDKATLQLEHGERSQYSINPLHMTGSGKGLFTMEIRYRTIKKIDKYSTTVGSITYMELTALLYIYLKEIAPNNAFKRAAKDRENFFSILQLDCFCLCSVERA